jgi:hypothetical protein
MHKAGKRKGKQRDGGISINSSGENKNRQRDEGIAINKFRGE